MVLINKAINEVTVKLVYYGPGLCGKTTNLEKIYANPKLDNKGKMISMSTETDRTLFFDFMPMELGTIAGQKVRVQLYTVPGQVFYDATRKLVLRGADGVVFVADSQAGMRESNLDSLENLRTNLRLNRIDPNKVAVVYQLNKRDLPNVASVEEMTEYLGATPASVVEASAKSGVGVTATLRNAVARILDNLKNNVDTTLYEEPALSAPDMSQKSGVAHHSAGTPKLSMRTESTRPAAPARAAAPVLASDIAAEISAELLDEPMDEPMVEPTPLPIEEPILDVSPFDTGSMAAHADEDPFAHVEPADSDETPHIDFEDPFAAPLAAPLAPSALENAITHAHVEEHRPSSDDRSELRALLTHARAVVASLEAALEHARANERTIEARLDQ